MPHVPFSSTKFSYNHQGHLKESSFRPIEIHEISISRSWIRVLLSYFSILLFLANSYYLLIVQEKIYLGYVWSIFVLMFAKFLQYNPVKKESVVIMQGFGVQLETHYWRGKVNRRFVPISRILWPVLNECVTPITCYWSLALVLHGEEHLMLVFKEVRPPLKMMLPVWKALSAIRDPEDASSS